MRHEAFDEVSELTELWTGRAWDGTSEHLQQAIAAQNWYIEALEAHNRWLTLTRSRALDAGRDWTTAEMRRQGRLLGDLTVPPEWLARLAENIEGRSA